MSNLKILENYRLSNIISWKILIHVKVKNDLKLLSLVTNKNSEKYKYLCIILRLHIVLHILNNDMIWIKEDFINLIFFVFK